MMNCPQDPQGWAEDILTLLEEEAWSSLVSASEVVSTKINK